jgi:hypothetical protein
MRLALDPAALAWALTPHGSAARAALLEHPAFVHADALARVRALRPRIEAGTGLARGEAWDLLQALLAGTEAVEAEACAEFQPLATRLVAPALAPTLAVALALEVDAVLAGGPGFEAQSLVPVLPCWPRPRQSRLA